MVYEMMMMLKLMTLMRFIILIWLLKVLFELILILFIFQGSPQISVHCALRYAGVLPGVLHHLNRFANKVVRTIPRCVVAGILPYLRRLTTLDEASLLKLFGWMVAINPIGQMIFSPIFGWITNKIGSIRIVCLVTCVIYIIGRNMADN